jgi:hypothetical protein
VSHVNVPGQTHDQEKNTGGRENIEKIDSANAAGLEDGLGRIRGIVVHLDFRFVGIALDNALRTTGARGKV